MRLSLTGGRREKMAPRLRLRGFEVVMAGEKKRESEIEVVKKYLLRTRFRLRPLQRH